MPPGLGNSLTDVPGLRVGHATLDGDGWLTGVTVVLAPPGGATCGVDVRGGGPGTRETDLLDPRNSVERVDAVVLGGGSAYGLAAAHGVLTRLAALGRGLPVGTAPSHVVPIVPAAILFDLGRGGVFGHYPGEQAGAAAFDAALAPAGAGAAACGNVGAGTGAVAGRLKGGTGAASTTVELPAVPGEPARAVTVAALAAVNAVGSVADERTGLLYGAQFGEPAEFGWLRPPGPGELAAAAGLLAPRGGGDRPGGTSGPAGTGGPTGTGGAGRPGTGGTGGAALPLPPPLNTTIGVVACDASLTKAQCAKLAGVAHDGLARAVRPAHSMFDGDTIFALATGSGPPVHPAGFHALLSAAADCFARAVVHGVLAARSVRTAGGAWPAYLDLFPSAGSRRAG